MENWSEWQTGKLNEKLASQFTGADFDGVLCILLLCAIMSRLCAWLMCHQYHDLIMIPSLNTHACSTNMFNNQTWDMNTGLFTWWIHPLKVFDVSIKSNPYKRRSGKGQFIHMVFPIKIGWHFTQGTVVWLNQCNSYPSYTSYILSSGHTFLHLPQIPDSCLNMLGHGPCQEALKVASQPQCLKLCHWNQEVQPFHVDSLWLPLINMYVVWTSCWHQYFLTKHRNCKVGI